jgi:hypothetical protein
MVTRHPPFFGGLFTRVILSEERSDAQDDTTMSGARPQPTRIPFALQKLEKTVLIN